MNDGQLARLISAMAAGQFRITGDTVVFDCKGNIQNAQHRFTACRDSGVTVKMLVVVGVPEDSFRTYDQHARRSLAQILGMENEESATVLAGLIYRVCSFLTTGNFAQGNNGTRAMTTEDLVAARDKYDGLRESVAFACGIPKLEARKFHGQTIIATLHWVLGKVDRPLAEEFLLAVCSSSIPKDRRWDPARLLAARLNGKSKLHRGETEVLAVKAWNALQAVKRPERLNLGKKGSFPEVAGWVYSNGRPLPQ